MSKTVLLEPLHAHWQECRLPFADYVTSFVSGDPEGDKIRVRYFTSPGEDVLWGRIWFGPAAEGPPKHAHGGAQAAAIDEICGGAVWVKGHKVVAVKLETNFVAFVPIGVELVLKGLILKKEGRKIYTEGTIETADGKVLARGNVLFLELSDAHIEQLVPDTHRG